MGSVEFVEEVLNLNLTSYQKRLLKSMEENDKNNKQVVLNRGRKTGVTYIKKLW